MSRILVAEDEQRIRYLRRKPDPRRIGTIRGIGYRLGAGSPAADG